MKVAILGTGNIGGNLAQLMARAGHEVFAGSRNPTASALQKVERITVTSYEDAIAATDMVIEALPFGQTMQLDPQLLAGKTLITTSNYDPERDGAWDTNPSESEALASRLPDTSVVKSFNVLYFKHLVDRVEGNPGNDFAFLVAGDDVNARRTVLQLSNDIGFDSFDAGNLSNGIRFQRSAEFFNKNLSKAEIEAAWFK